MIVLSFPFRFALIINVSPIPLFKSIPIFSSRALLQMNHTTFLTLACCCFISQTAHAQAELDFSRITERHEMIPMRDGNRLSAYLYLPPGSGPWPAVFEQRYADLRGAGTRKAAAKLAEA